MDLQTPFVLTILATGLPPAAAALILIFLRRRGAWSAAVALAASGISLVAAVGLLVVLAHQEAPVHFVGRWLVSGAVTVRFGYLLDPLSLLMLVIVAAICFLVQVYSLGYMAGDPGFGRYYGFLSLFAWAMLNLTLAATLLQLFIFWELVGLSSYLLIGFWFEKFSATQAGKKAFVMTRFGDVAFYLGILLLVVHAGLLDIEQLNHPVAVAGLTGPLITAAALLMLGGVIGKSAQFPLLTWLPDAMEGPTPVSALLHSATMVAAGVYLLARLHGFFAQSSTAMTVCLAIGTISMLAAASMAMVAHDMKQVWAFSTISQLGFMLMAMGAGGYAAGVFHLTTHAGFKALLFLCAGVFIHRFETNDITAIGRGGGAGMAIPMVAMAVGAAALAGLPPFSGFFSKEQILGALAALSNPFWLAAGLLGVFLTAYYAFRLIFMIWHLRGATEADPADSGHGGAGAAGAMTAVLVILVLATLVLGWLRGPLEDFLTGAAQVSEAAHPSWLPFAALALALAGVAVVWLEFGRRRAPGRGFVERMPRLARFFARRWYLDDFYRVLLRRLVDGGLALFCAGSDRRVIDAGLDGLSRAVIGGGRDLARRHAGAIQSRLAVIFAVVAVMTAYVLMHDRAEALIYRIMGW